MKRLTFSVLSSLFALMISIQASASIEQTFQDSRSITSHNRSYIGADNKMISAPLKLAGETTTTTKTTSSSDDTDDDDNSSQDNKPTGPSGAGASYEGQ